METAAISESAAPSTSAAPAATTEEQPSQSQSHTQIVYYPEPENEGYLIRVSVAPEAITLADVKRALLGVARPNTKYFFKAVAEDEDLGVVKEEISEEGAKLPLHHGRVFCYLVCTDGSTHSDTTLDATLTPGRFRSSPHRPDHAPAPVQQSNSDAESTISGLPSFPRHNTKLRGRPPRIPPVPTQKPRFPADSTLTSDLDTTSYFDSGDDDTTCVSTSTDITSVSRLQQNRRRQRKHRAKGFSHPHPRVPSRTSSFTSITESSMSLNIITVTLNMDTVKFLGISIVGQKGQQGDNGIYVGSIMHGGAVALDGRIDVGDLIIAVNDTSLDVMTNDQAVMALKTASANSGPVRITVAKPWDSNPRGYFTIPQAHEEPVRPIDPGAWIAHTNAHIGQRALAAGSITPTPQQQHQQMQQLPRPHSSSTHTSHSGSHTNSIPESDAWQQRAQQQMLPQQLDVHLHSMAIITAAVASPQSGLVVKDRTWLKITIPRAFLGSDMIAWLSEHVAGLKDKKEARGYASKMLRDGFIRHSVNKSSFSEQCYYTFGSPSAASTPVPQPMMGHLPPEPTSWALGSVPVPPPPPVASSQPLYPPPQPPPSMRTQSPQFMRPVAPSEATRSSELGNSSGGSSAAASRHRDTRQRQETAMHTGLTAQMDELSISRQSYKQAVDSDTRFVDVM